MYDTNNKKHQKLLVDTIHKNKKNNINNYWNVSTEELNKTFKEDTLKETWRTRFRSLEEEYIATRQKAVHNNQNQFNLEKRLLSYLNKEVTLEYLTKMLNLTEVEVLGLIGKLKRDGYEILELGNNFKIAKQITKKNQSIEPFKGDVERVNLCIVSDTHIGNKKQQITMLNEFYDMCVEKGITTVLHVGDISDGTSHREDHVYELFAYGAEEQVDYIVENYPKREGIKTYFITGNHDAWYAKKGVNIGKMIDSRREDMIYLGHQNATIKIKRPNGFCNIRMFHPQDGSSYAISNSGQKAIDAIRDGNYPDIMLVGHHHKQFYMVYRGVHYLEVPCVCELTGFMEGKKIPNDMGCWFIDMTVNEFGDIVEFTPTAVVKTKGIQNDYVMPDKKNYRKEYII